jgi:hypothetical protein
LSTYPCITIVAAPSLTTLGPFSAEDPPGITFSDFWEDSVLVCYGINSLAGLHCPLMVATKLPGALELLTESQPLFFPLEEQLVEQVPLTSGSKYHMFFLPEVCSLPLSLAWPTTISFVDLFSSIQGLKSGNSHFLQILKFLQILTALQPELTSWL